MKPEDLARKVASEKIDRLAGVTMLGNKTDQPDNPDKAALETILIEGDQSNHGFHIKFAVRLACPEFTSLCPKTGQPDFAHIVIDYVPHRHLIESKSLKLFMASFRNHGSFHEEVTNYIARRFWDAAEPDWLRVSAFWYPRGGIPIDVFVQFGDFPDFCYLPPLDISSYRGR